MSNTRYDVIVVGSGPAGSAAAHELAARGLHTLILEKAKLPRYKTCGGGVTYKAARVLPFSIEPSAERVINRVVFSWKMDQPFQVDSDSPLLYMVQRSKFDNYLAERAAAAGAELLDETTVTTVEEVGREVRVASSRGAFTASYVVGADGATGRVARSMGLMADRQAIPALESEIEVADEVMDFWKDKVGLDLGRLKASYGWIFPKGEHLSVGVGGYPLAPNFGTRLKEYAEEHARARVPGIRRVISTHGYLLPLRRPGAPVQRGRVVLAGDAAGLVEAFTGEGIYWALRSGQIPAEAIASANGALDYQERLDAALMPDLVAARRWMHIYFWLPRACYALPKHIPAFWRVVRSIVRGELHYTDIGRSLGPLSFTEKLIPYGVALRRESAGA